MKKSFTLLFAVALAACSFSTAQAFPIGKSNESGDYLFGTGLSHLLSAGVYGGSSERDVQFGATILPLKSTKAVVYVGVDLLPWFTVFVGGGTASHELGMSDSDSSYQAEAGVLINLIDHEILDPTLFEDRLRLNFAANWGLTEANWYNDDIKWQEINVSLTISIVNDTTGNKFFNPNSIALYAGPMFSYIESDDIEADQELGFTAGIEVFATESISMNIGLRQLDGTGVEGGLHIRF